MRVGVEEPVLENHLGDDQRRALGERVAIEAGFVERRQVGDLHAADPFERDHARGGEIREDARDLDPRIVGEVGRETLGVAHLLQVVELCAERVHEFVRQTHHVVASGRLRMPARARGEVLDDLEVPLHVLDHVRPAHLHDHVGSVVQRRGMGLSDRRAGERRGSKVANAVSAGA